MRTLLQKKDFYAGLFMVLLGAGVVLNSTTYKLGTFMHMGPGMFPFMLGIMMMFVGALIFITGVATPLDEGERILPESMEWRGWACILAGPLMFILFGVYLGMAAATFMCVFVSALGDRTATLKGSAILAACITVGGCLLFSYVLKVPFPLFRWGF
ncbi:MAG TPA: tripartite tricarboxylate transporter TctB family protein [Bradyrhizobium sp.]|nr:tripartite tricarboxylate transporter TctB family protein [Bradyrhizobium sp.]